MELIVSALAVPWAGSLIGLAFAVAIIGLVFVVVLYAGVYYAVPRLIVKFLGQMAPRRLA